VHGLARVVWLESSRAAGQNCPCLTLSRADGSSCHRPVSRQGASRQRRRGRAQPGSCSVLPFAVAMLVLSPRPRPISDALCEMLKLSVLNLSQRLFTPRTPRVSGATYSDCHAAAAALHPRPAAAPPPIAIIAADVQKIF
jgi:hypothetical protein